MEVKLQIVCECDVNKKQKQKQKQKQNKGKNQELFPLIEVEDASLFLLSDTNMCTLP